MYTMFDPQVVSSLLLFGAGGVIDKLLPNYTFFIQMFFFVACFLILRNYLFPPVLEVLLERQKKVEQAHQELKKYEKEGEEMEEKYQETIRDARIQAQKIYKDARSEASEEERRIVEAARSEANQTMVEREQQAQKQRDSLRANLDSDADNLAQEIASKVLGRTV